MRTVGLYTLGCKVSQYETEAVAEAFVKAGYEVRPYESVCDAYVINTCTVTAESDRKCRQMIRRAIKAAPDAVVAVMGCYSQSAPMDVAAIRGVDIVLGTQDKLSVVERVSARLAERERGEIGSADVSVRSLSEAAFEPMCIQHAPRTRAYVKIEDGCECRCSYCAIPAARGPVRSKSPSDVIAEVEGLAKSGCREIVLTGIETASYGVDFDTPYRLIDLLEELSRRGSCERIRLGSLTPELMREDFVERIAALPEIAPHFHLSMQSGCDNVLRGMRRRYNVAMAKDVLERLRRAMPRVQFTTDLMVGFPGETDEDFEDTMNFVSECRFLDIHVFAYSRRRGTPADTFDGQIPEKDKRERSARLIKLKNEIREQILSELVASGDSLSVIMETRTEDGYTAHSDTFVEVHVLTDIPDLHGEIMTVRPVSHKDGILYAVLENAN